MKTYRRHNCTRHHRSHNTLAKCIWPHAIWITGEGPYALLARCRTLTVTLYADPESSRTAQHGIDRSGCSGGCSRNHETIHLDLEDIHAT